VQLASGSKEAVPRLEEPDPTVLSERLSEGDAILAYRRYTRSEIHPGQTEERTTESLCAFVLRQGAELQRIELGPIEPIAAAVRDWRDTLGVVPGRGLAGAAREGDSEIESARARRIAALVWEPLLPNLGDARRVGIVVDDVLTAVPIDVLPMVHAGKDAPIGDRWELETRLTLQGLLSDVESGSDPRDGIALVLGGADFSAEPTAHDASREERSASVNGRTDHPFTTLSTAGVLRGGAWEAGFTALPGTLREARGIAELAQQALGSHATTLLEASEASCGSIEELGPKARFLHLATHGWFAPESVRSWSDPEQVDGQGGALARMSAEERIRGSSPMLLCGLALSGANLPADTLGRNPGLVTAEEISTWDLSRCELAVLSACDTNVGERRAGQGVASLQRALHMAGARTVITSLWKVPDEATKDLMLDFYRRIWVEKKPKAQALWEAKMRMRVAVDERGQLLYSTRDWAAWVLTGDPRYSPGTPSSGESRRCARYARAQ
jgi:hypothetical protein